jgi:hypothetical protein
MENSTILTSDGYIFNIYAGDQTGKKVLVEVEKTKKLIEQLRQDKKPVHILIDLNTLGKTDSETRSIAVSTLKNLDYDKLAFYGNNLFTKYLANFIISATGRNSQIQYFESKEKALEWINT